MKESVFVMLGELTTINLSDLDGSKLSVNASEVAVTEGKKRPLCISDDGAEAGLTSKELWAEEKGGRRAKKFRVEWMNEVYFKDWLRPHPTDETYCICIACDIRLRCGKSELEKHASGLKHCRRMDAMKENPNRNTRVSLLTEGSHIQASDRILCEENGTFYVATDGENLEEQQDSGDSLNMATVSVDSVLSKVLLKLSQYVESDADVTKRKMEMLEAEHQRRMQVLNKELELRSLEVLIRQTELQRLNSCTPRTRSGTVVMTSINEDNEKY